MKKPSEHHDDWDERRARIIGLGEQSSRKSHYPALRARLSELEASNHALAQEVARRKQTEILLRASEENFRSLIVNTSDLIIRLGRRAEILYVNDPLDRDPTTCGPIATLFDMLLPAHHERLEAALGRVFSGQRDAFEAELRSIRHIGGWHAIRLGPIRAHEERRIVAATCIARDINDRIEAERTLRERAELEHTLRRELDHRVRNNLASLIALVDIGADSNATPADLAGSMRSRIAAMAEVHSLLSQTQWKPIEFRSVVLRAVGLGEDARARVEGEGFPLPPELVQPVVMILNELATNSRKYGALRDPTGSLHVSWTVDATEAARRIVTLRWKEEGGPAPVPPSEHGTGLQLVAGLARSELRGRADLRFSPNGVDHLITMSIERFDRSDSKSTSTAVP
jgi:two-component sensor histidine kinase/PAS domain-containing protein